MGFDPEAREMAAAAVAAAQNISVNPANLIPGVSNFDPLLLPKARAAFAKVRLSRGRAKVATLGDSTWAGIGAGTGGDHNLTGARQATVAWTIATILNGRGLPAIPDAVFSCGAVPAPTIYNPNVVQGSGWVLSGQNTAGGTLWQNGTTTGTVLSVTTTTPCNAFDVYYANVNTAQFTLQIDSETPVTVNVTSAGNALLKATVTTTIEGIHTLNIVRTGASGNVFIGMIDPYSTAKPRASIWNMGIGGSQTSTWINTSASWSTLNALTTYAPDLTLINLGINDEGNNVSIPTFTANMQTIINGAKASGDVALIMHHSCSGHEAQEPATYAALQQLAANNNCPLIDFRARLGLWTAANANGQMYDNLHASGPGYADEGSMIADLLARL
ncbi:lysophospholipase L1-like esterase [Rhodoblastus acidophilus]|uniref:SGNH/GDSL hydrolase family protein n=1 Tax=Rhodoblastus acidophilus TaxID=1074 RepID=UPI0022249264|nr:SGNH/GDSL hydrolase family protein [Rhodoblastus acidophilus]MCW2318304.1 lysophospholipase L1-like esterase [Rhodoblastus acidophilus]